LTDTDADSIELLFFGPIAEEVLRACVNDLLSANDAGCACLPSRITDLYGKHTGLQVSFFDFSVFFLCPAERVFEISTFYLFYSAVNIPHFFLLV